MIWKPRGASVGQRSLQLCAHCIAERGVSELRLRRPWGAGTYEGTSNAEYGGIVLYVCVCVFLLTLSSLAPPPHVSPPHLLMNRGSLQSITESSQEYLFSFHGRAIARGDSRS